MIKVNTMRFIVRFADRFLKKDIEKPVGRWFRDSCEKTIARKVDLSNEDHCGPCGEYTMKKMNSLTPISSDKIILLDSKK